MTPPKFSINLSYGEGFYLSFSSKNTTLNKLLDKHIWLYGYSRARYGKAYYGDSTSFLFVDKGHPHYSEIVEVINNLSTLSESVAIVYLSNVIDSLSPSI
jgi:hypothetical protein